MDQLEPCPHCQRHVRIFESACPFCDAPLAQAMAQVRARVLPGTRLGRAALFAYGVGAGLAAVGAEGCADDTDPQTAAPEALAEELDYQTGSVVALYGAPAEPIDRPPARPPRDAAVDASVAPDAGAAPDAGRPRGIDAGQRPDDRDRGGTSFPLYAAPPLRQRE